MRLRFPNHWVFWARKDTITIKRRSRRSVPEQALRPPLPPRQRRIVYLPFFAVIPFFPPFDRVLPFSICFRQEGANVAFYTPPPRPRLGSRSLSLITPPSPPPRVPLPFSPQGRADCDRHQQGTPSAFLLDICGDLAGHPLDFSLIIALLNRSAGPRFQSTPPHPSLLRLPFCSTPEVACRVQADRALGYKAIFFF